MENIINKQCECSYIITKEDIEEYLKKDPEKIFKFQCPSCSNTINWVPKKHSFLFAQIAIKLLTLLYL